MNKSFPYFVLLLKIITFSSLLVFYSLQAVAQQEGSTNSDSTSLKESLTEESSLESVERVIQVSSVTSDKKIQQRLLSILDSSEKYTELSIKVADGLVFIDALTDETSYVKWAGDIAKNIEGIVAVVNNIQVNDVAYLSYSPIKNELLRLWLNGLEVVPLIVAGMSVFLLFFFLAKPISHWLTKPISYLSDSELIRVVLKRTISIFFILIGLYFFLRIAGLTQFALAIISGTGVLGLIVGFAFRDIAENFISSLLLSVQRPFHLGDVIQVQGHKGVVRKVTARGTTLIDFDGNHIQIPNATIYKNIIQNFSANPKLRGHFMIGVGYDASIKQAQEIAINLMQAHNAVLDDPEPQVLIDNLGSATVNFKVLFWIDSQRYAVAKVSSLLMRQVMREFEKNGLPMPDDSREVIFPQGVPVMLQQPSSGHIVSDTSSQAHTEKLKEYEPAESLNTISDAIQADSRHDDDHIADDLSSDTDNIREQADAARDPEEGNNII